MAGMRSASSVVIPVTWRALWKCGRRLAKAIMGRLEEVPGLGDEAKECSLGIQPNLFRT